MDAGSDWAGTQSWLDVTGTQFVVLVDDENAQSTARNVDLQTELAALGQQFGQVESDTGTRRNADPAQIGDIDNALVAVDRDVRDCIRVVRIDQLQLG